MGNRLTPLIKLSGKSHLSFSVFSKVCKIFVEKMPSTVHRNGEGKGGESILTLPPQKVEEEGSTPVHVAPQNMIRYGTGFI